jgi:hypothetical protein
MASPPLLILKHGPDTPPYLARKLYEQTQQSSVRQLLFHIEHVSNGALSQHMEGECKAHPYLRCTSIVHAEFRYECDAQILSGHPSRQIYSIKVTTALSV